MVHSIHPRTVQEVKEKADIVEVISEHIVLKKKGKEFVGICPFHDDTKLSIIMKRTYPYKFLAFLLENNMFRYNLNNVCLFLNLLNSSWVYRMNHRDFYKKTNNDLFVIGQN